MPSYVAVDLGAESGRVVRGDIRSDRLRLEEVARFPTGMVRRQGRLCWDVPRMQDAVVAALAAAGAGGPLDGIGVDAWGVDFGLLGEDEELLELPVAYRDPRTEGVMERFFERIPAERIYRKTGIQFLPFNTLYQLTALAESRARVLADARHLLLIPDLILHHLSGRRSTEFTDATTTQCLNLGSGEWDQELIEATGVDPGLLQEVTGPGTVLGPLAGPVREITGLGPVPVIAPATHDTGSAVAAVPAVGDDWAFISSGTWSLVGVETDEPVVSETTRDLDLTNEGGVDGTYRLLTNIPGLWLVQRCRASLPWLPGYEELTRRAARSPPLVSLVDPGHPGFLDPPSMPEAIADFCLATGQAAPETPGALIRCVLESLALEYRTALDDLRRVTGRPIRRIHVVGGGVKNRLLARMTADATGLPVTAGPVEATAVGNLLVQARALGHLDSQAEARSLVRRSFDLEEYEPRDPDRWEAARRRFQALRTTP